MSEHMHTFDTHKHIKELEAVGFKEKQAEALVQSFLISRETDLSKLATKEQVESLKQATKEQIESLRQSTNERFSNLDKRMDGLDKRMDKLEEKIEKFATKDYLSAEISKIQSSIHETQTTMIKWMIGTLLAFSGIILASLKLFI